MRFRKESSDQGRVPLSLRSTHWQTRMSFALSFLALGAIGFGAWSAMNSTLFVVQVVEIVDGRELNAKALASGLEEVLPVDAAAISKLAAVQIGRSSLFELDLGAIEKRILTHPWVKSVRLEKRFPQTLGISVAFREPRAIFRHLDGSLSYVDEEGRVFGDFVMNVRPDLPILARLPEAQGGVDQAALKNAIHVIADWSESGLVQVADLSELYFDSERGFRALISYEANASALRGRARVIVDLGQGKDLERLTEVLRYLSRHGIVARQIFADSGKKVVVKTSSRS